MATIRGCIILALVSTCIAQDDAYVEDQVRIMGSAKDVSLELLQVKASYVNNDAEGAPFDEEEVWELDNDEAVDSGDNADDHIDESVLAEFDSDDAVVFDDSDVPAAEHCDAFEKGNPNLVKVDFNVARVAVSNLGGVGPDSGAAEQLYYKDAAGNAEGAKYDLKVRVRGDSYTPRKPKFNGENGHYGVINVKCGTSVDLEFQFIDPQTGQPATLDHLIFSWFDLDSGRLGGGEEQVVLWPGHTNTIVSSYSEVKQKEVDCPANAGAQKCKSFMSSTWGVGKDNPTDPLLVTKQQAARTFSVEYRKVSSFSVTLKAFDGFGSRNFLFTGMSQVAYMLVDECCPAHVCGCRPFCAEKGDATWEQKCTMEGCNACDECTQTTTTTSPAPASKEETCNDGLSFELSSDNLVENSLGKDLNQETQGRMLFKKVLVYEGRSLDLSVTDVAKDKKHATLGWLQFEVDKRAYTGEYRGAGRIAFDFPGQYIFRFTFLDSATGEQVKLPLFPFTVYDIDGKGEAVSACGPAGAVTHEESWLTEFSAEGCYHHISTHKEVNLPQDFDSLTPNQKKKAVTYAYRNTGAWELGVTLSKLTKERYILFKSSKVLACNYADYTREKWKNKGKKADA